MQWKSLSFGTHTRFAHQSNIISSQCRKAILNSIHSQQVSKKCLRCCSKLTYSRTASLSTGSKTWRVKIDLTHVQKAPTSWNKKYCVIGKISGVWEVDIVAETGLPARKIGCVMT